MGVYLRPDSDIFWLSYTDGGKRIRESTGSHDKKEAERILKDKEGRRARGEAVLPRADKVRYEELVEDLVRHYRNTEDRDLVEVQTRLAHLDRFFTGMRAVAIEAPVIERYVEQRKAAGAANGTVNRELGLLVKMFRLAQENRRVTMLPVVSKLKEAEPRQGFFERHQYEAVRRHLPEDLQVAVTIAHTYGWRMQSEVLALERRHLDLEAGTLRLYTSKNDDGRVVYLTPELIALLQAQAVRVQALEHRLGRIIPWLFPHEVVQFAGTRRKDFRKAWATACRRAGCPGMLRHDFRRTAVRDLVNEGTSEKVAMTVTGHKTRSVFDRYHIVNPADLKEAARRIAARPVLSRSVSR